MTGPRIIARESELSPSPRPHRFHGQTGVRHIAGGGCVAIVDGRFAGEFHGRRAFLAAARAAGTTTVLR